MQLNGFEFPFSRGASFYEVTEAGQILYGRDLVEPALKPGSSALLVRSSPVPSLSPVIALCIALRLVCSDNCRATCSVWRSEQPAPGLASLCFQIMSALAY